MCLSFETDRDRSENSEVCEEVDGSFFECQAGGETFENVITTRVG